VVPNPGDRAEIYFEIPGLSDVASVASGSVTSVTGGVITIEIQKAATKVKQGQLARIDSKNPRARNAAPSPMPSAAAPEPAPKPPSPSPMPSPPAPLPEPVEPATAGDRLDAVGGLIADYVAVEGHYPTNIEYAGRPMLSWRVSMLSILGPKGAEL